MIRRWTSCLAVLAALTGMAQAQAPVLVSQAAYDRATRFQNASGLVRNLVIVHHWLPGRDEFWYRRETEAGAEYLIVDAATGRKRPAFDHAALARALTAALGREVSADGLPLTDVEFAADGSLVVATPASADEVLRNGRQPTPDRRYRCRLGTPACERVAPRAGEAGTERSPDGRLGAFERGGNLWIRDLGAGTERQLTRDGQGPDDGYAITPDGWKATMIPRSRLRAAGGSLPPFAVTWSPDGRTVLFPRIDQRHVAPYPLVETVPEDGSPRPKAHAVRVPLVGERPAVVEWYVADVPSGRVTKLDLPVDQLLVLQQDLLPLAGIWWSPGGDRLFLAAWGDNMESAFLFDADLATGRVRTVIEERATPRVDLNSTSYNPPNVYVTADGRTALWWSQRDGWGHLYRYDVATGRLVNQVTRGDWLVRDLLSVDDAKQLVYFTANGDDAANPYRRAIYRVRFDGTGLTRLSPESADVMVTPGVAVSRRDGGSGSAAVSPSGTFFVYNHSTPSRPTEFVIRRTADRRLVSTVDAADASRLLALGFRPPEEFTARTFDGKDVTYNVVYRPLDFDSTRRYPVIDVNYASPLTAVVPRNFAMAFRGPSGISPSAFAALGFVVVVVDGRGTTFRSRAFTQSGYGHLDLNGVDDHVAAIRELGRRYPWVDTTRVGITGGSYGGWTTIRGMLAFPDFYRVGFAESAPGSMHNMYVDYHWSAMHGRPRYADGSERRGGPTEVPTNWRGLDSRPEAGRLAGRLMLTISELDENVVPGSTMQFVDALMKADKDFDLLVLPDTPHMSGRYYGYVVRRRFDYFVKHLLGATPPSDAAYQLK